MKLSIIVCAFLLIISSPCYAFIGFFWWLVGWDSSKPLENQKYHAEWFINTFDEEHNKTQKELRKQFFALANRCKDPSDLNDIKKNLTDIAHKIQNNAQKYGASMLAQGHVIHVANNLTENKQEQPLKTQLTT
jgi:hypothetical protein